MEWSLFKYNLSLIFLEDEDLIEEIINQKDVYNILENKPLFFINELFESQPKFKLEDDSIIYNYEEFKEEILKKSYEYQIYFDLIDDFYSYLFKIVDKINNYQIDLYSLIKENKKNSISYIEKIKDAASLYKNKKEFSKNNDNFYRRSKKIGADFFNYICSHMEGNISWDKDLVREEAKKYETRKEFELGNRKAYSYALRQGKKFIDEICSHMENQLIYWTYDLARKEAKKYETRKEFELGNRKAYRYAIKENILDEICSHMKSGKKIWTKEMLREEAKKYKSRKEFNEKNSGAYQAAKNKFGKDFYESICSHMDWNAGEEWTEEAIINEAKKYTTRRDFRLYGKGAINAARKKGKKFYEKVCSHMDKAFKEHEREYKETIFKPKLETLLQSYNIEYELKYEYRIPKRDNNDGVIDFLLILPNYELLIPIEIKNDDSYWNENSVTRQINKYNRAFRERKGMTGTYLVSPEGTYGFSEKEFFDLIENIFVNEEILLPNSLDWYLKLRGN